MKVSWLLLAGALATAGCGGGGGAVAVAAGLDVQVEAAFDSSDSEPTITCTTNTDCVQGQSCCGGGCVDLTSNPYHCGYCQNACGGGLGFNGTATCTAGSCVLTCAAGFADCDHIEANGCEADLSIAPENCGACGTACLFANALPACQAGKCSVASCDQGFGDCNNNPTDGCEADLSSDPLNCAKCGTACASTASACGNGSFPACNAIPVCRAGLCGLGDCNAGYADCNKDPADGCEVDLLTDGNNCGACGMTCAGLPHASPACSGAACTVGTCDAGWGDCNKSAFDGCEANLAADPNNCSACGDVCPTPLNGVASCTASMCGIASCAAGYADCSGPTGACTVQLATDVSNCGMCGNACPAITNGVAACLDYQCAIGHCTGVFAHCSGTTLACETDTSAAVDNCGACGNFCPLIANGTRACVNSGCAIGMCNVGFGDCNMNPADGCETDLTAAVQDCAACGTVCPAPPNGTASCVASACGLASCLPGFSNCDGNAANGCERNTQTDPMNCGGCGIVCGSGTCTNSVCGCNNTVLVIADDSASGTATLVTALGAANLTVTQTAVPSYQYNGTNPSPTGFGAIVLLAGGPASTSYTTDMPLAGQTAIVSFVKAGNGLVLTEWAALQVANGRWQTLAPYVLLTRTSAYSGQVTYQVDPAYANHPVWAGLPASFTFASTSNVGVTKTAAGVSRLAGSPDAIDAVAILDAPAGRAVHVAHAGNIDPFGWSNPSMQTLIANAVGWVSRCK